MRDTRLINESQLISYVPVWANGTEKHDTIYITLTIWIPKCTKRIIHQELHTLAPQKILKYKSNKLCTRSIWGKVQNSDEQINKRNK